MSTLHLKQKGDLGQIQFSASSFSQKNRMIFFFTQEVWLFKLSHDKLYLWNFSVWQRFIFIKATKLTRTEHTPDNSSKEINPGSVSSVSGGPSLRLLILYMLVQQQ